jgi:iron complex outermembrane receptor protein
LALKEAENDGYIDMAVRAGYRSQDGWSAVAYVENVTDEVYYDGSAEGSGILPAHYFGISRPRTMGMKVSWEF